MADARTPLILTLAMTLAACGSDDPRTPDQASFVGRASCASCHRREMDAWQGSHHDLAMQEATAETVLGDYADATFDYSGIETTFSTRDGRFIVNTDGPDGVLRDYEIRYAFGVTPLQQYLVEIERGRLQALEIAWDSRPTENGGQRWFHLYPNEAIDHRDELHWTGRAMNWNYMCATCHSTDFRRGYDLDGDRYASTFAEIDVSCEACHGAASKHVAWANAGASPSDPSKGLAVLLPGPGTWVFAPGATIASRDEPVRAHPEVETCAPCHSRRSQFDEAPWHGAPYLDRYEPSLLDAGLYQPDGQILDEVYVYGSFVQSKMYRAGVTCSDCHDAHSARLRVTGNALCIRCHLSSTFDVPSHHHHEPGSAATRCIECHMAARTYMVVDPRRDHSFRIPRPDESVAIGTPNACQTCHAAEGAAWAATAVRTWRGERPAPQPSFGRALFDARLGKPGATGGLLRLATDHERPGIARATAVVGLADHAATLDPGALRSLFTDADPLVRRGAAELLEALPVESRVSLGTALLEDPIRTVRAHAGRALASVPPEALTPAQRGAAQRALQDWIGFQEANRDQPWGHLNLGVLFAERGDVARAEVAYRTALRIEPRAIQPRVNLADLQREAGDDALSESILREGLETDPGSAELRHALGLTLVRRDRREEGIAELERAATTRPENARFSYVYAVALHSSDAQERALEVLESALVRHPFDRDLLFGMASFLRDRGETARAIEFAERLVAVEPAAQQLLDELRRTQR